MKYKLVLFDVDSTLINQEVIDLIAKRTESHELVASITDRAMRGEIDFDQALAERVNLLSGLPEQVFSDVIQEITFTPGAIELIFALQEQDIAVGIVSGGFHNVLDVLFKDYNLGYVKANTLAVENGRLTGKVSGSIVNKAFKAKALFEFASAISAELGETVAVGDGSNDFEMIQAAGLGISFCGKPILEEAADVVIKERNLLKVLDFLN